MLVIAASVAGCLVTERLFGKRKNSLADGSAMITGLLLGLCLPAGFPLWMAFVGGVFAIGFGKIIFGGLGENIFNPDYITFLRQLHETLANAPAEGGIDYNNARSIDL